ncbi:MAG: DsbC family protein [Gammaproteobacteria bacterium]
MRPILIRAILLLTGIACLRIAAAGEVSGPPVDASGAGLPDLFKQIESVKRLPVSGLQMVRTTAGSHLFLSANGRFVLKGELYDLWNRAPIRTIDDAERFADRVDLARMGLSIDDLQPLVVGHGSETVVVFVDPHCPYCQAVLRAAAALEDRYTFKIVLVPVLGPQSQQVVRQMGCLPAAQRADLVQRLRAEGLGDLPAAPADCDLAPIQRAMVSAQLLGVDAVPFLIAPDGRIRKGRPDDLAAWLAPPTIAAGSGKATP